MIAFTSAFLARLVPVEEDGRNDQSCPKTELNRDLESEQSDGDDARNDDCQGASESLEDVVRVLDHHRHQQSASRVQSHQVHDEQVVTEKESVLSDSLAVFGVTDQHTKRNGQDAQLNVSHPNRHVGTWTKNTKS